LPPHRDEVVVPTSAIVETGEEGIIYSVDARRPNEFTRRKVVVSHRGRLFAYLRTALTEEEKARGLTALGHDERVASSGVVLLENSWKELSLRSTSAEPHLAGQDASHR
jgi:hypothetical protein